MLGPKETYKPVAFSSNFSSETLSSLQWHWYRYSAFLNSSGFKLRI